MRYLCLWNLVAPHGVENGGAGVAYPVAALAVRAARAGYPCCRLLPCRQSPGDHRQRADPPVARIPGQRLDLVDEASIRDWAGQAGDIDWLISAAGILHSRSHGPEKTIRQLDQAFFMENGRSNSLPSLLLAKHLHDRFRQGRPAVYATVSAKVGSIEENRLGGWFRYRASKAPLNRGLKTLAIGWRRSLPDVAVAALPPAPRIARCHGPFSAMSRPRSCLRPSTVSAACSRFWMVSRLHNQGSSWPLTASSCPGKCDLSTWSAGPVPCVGRGRTPLLAVQACSRWRPAAPVTSARACRGSANSFRSLAYSRDTADGGCCPAVTWLDSVGRFSALVASCT